LRQLYPVETICMHGSPYSKYDNKALWEEYSYSQYGIIAEPYFDLNFNDMLYLTDTGRRWDGAAFSVRDKISVDHASMIELKGELKSTMDIISAAESGFLPDKLMITTHPQRWTDQLIPWTRELVLQNFKNIIKYIIVRSRR